MHLAWGELLAEHKPPLTGYAVAKASKGRITISTIYRLSQNEGRVANFDGELLEAIYDVFRIGPNVLLEREGHGRRKRRSG